MRVVTKSYFCEKYTPYTRAEASPVGAKIENRRGDIKQPARLQIVEIHTAIRVLPSDVVTMIIPKNLYVNITTVT